MKFPFYVFFAIVTLFPTYVCAAESSAAKVSSDQPANLRAASYDGTWSGTIKCLYDPGLWPEDECDIGLTFNIQGDRLLVEQVIRTKKGQEIKSAVYPGKFQFGYLSTNAVAVALDTGDDEDGTWVETWSFAMTLTDPDHMTVHWTRIVNNIGMPKDKKGSKFSSVGMGELIRKLPI